MRDVSERLVLPAAGGGASFVFLPHDSEIFGVPCYRFSGAVEDGAENKLSGSPEGAMLTMKVDANSLPRWRNVLDQYGFSFVDTELCLAGSLVSGQPEPATFRNVVFSDDTSLLVDLSPDIFRDLHSRFHLDSRLEMSLVVEFWKRYLSDMLQSGRSWALFPVKQGRPVGVCLFAVNSERLDIQLIALDPEVRGRGLASALLGHAVHITGIKAGATEVYAGAKPAMNFYLRNGLVSVGKVSHVFHAWIPIANR